jgi:prepilin-type N-terminal cleavage/methylation domain-containing protein
MAEWRFSLSGLTPERLDAVSLVWLKSILAFVARVAYDSGGGPQDRVCPRAGGANNAPDAVWFFRSGFPLYGLRASGTIMVMSRTERMAAGGHVYYVLKRAGGRLRVCRRPRKHAFTLIELLVVLAIIAVLMAILLSVLQGARKQAQDIKRRADLRQHDIVQRMNDGDTARDPERSTKKRRSR